jgi:hypothetical protein
VTQSPGQGQYVGGSMNKICITVGVIFFSWLGWWLGDKLHFGLMATYLISGIGSLVGVYVGWFINQTFLS